MWMLLLLSHQLLAEPCDWGFAGPKFFQCDGETYVYGEASCPSGFHNSLFCRQSFLADAEACVGDKSPATTECHRKLLEGGSLPPATKCAWKGAKQDVVCDGQKYCAGEVVCAEGVHAQAFCAKRYCDKVDLCVQDNGAATVKCHEAKKPSLSSPSGPSVEPRIDR